METTRIHFLREPESVDHILQSNLFKKPNPSQTGCMNTYGLFVTIVSHHSKEVRKGNHALTKLNNQIQSLPCHAGHPTLWSPFPFQHVTLYTRQLKSCHLDRHEVCPALRLDIPFLQYFYLWIVLNLLRLGTNEDEMRTY